MTTLRLATKHLHLAIRTIQEQLFNNDNNDADSQSQISHNDSASPLVPEALAAQLSYYHSKLADCFLSISLERQRRGQIVTGLEALESSLMERAKLQMLRRGPDPNRPEQCRLTREAAEKSSASEESKEGMDGSGGSYKYSYSSYRLRPSQTNLFSATDTVFFFVSKRG